MPGQFSTSGAVGRVYSIRVSNCNVLMQAARWASLLYTFVLRVKPADCIPGAQQWFAHCNGDAGLWLVPHSQAVTLVRSP
jgi:hypothetical protein